MDNRIKNIEADLVIIGGGTAGLPAAVAAAEQGCKRIIVLEKLGILGGNAAVGAGGYGGIFGVESPVQKRTENIDASRDGLFRTALRWAHWDVDPRIVRAFIDKSGDTIRWLESKGVNFALVSVYPNQVPLVLHVPKETDGGFMKGSAEMMRVLGSNCEGLGIKILTHTRVKKILTRDNGVISGVLAETPDEKLIIKSKAVIIATGGFGRNKVLLKKYFSNYHDTMQYKGVPNTGDGLRLASEIGASVEGSATMLIGPPVSAQAANLLIENPGSAGIQVSLSSLIYEPYILRVNKKGKRFIGYDEAAPPDIFIGNSYAMLRQPDGIGYALFDDEIRQMMEENGTIINRRPNTAAQRHQLNGLKRELKLQADKGTIKMANSLDEIANWVGIDPKILKATVDEYNAVCDHGYDPIFNQDRKHLLALRKAPYYAIECHGFFLDTLGGITINENMEVLDRQYNPIPGLYAAGATTGGWEGKIYCYVVSGEARGFAINSGRIAGENAATFLAK